MKKSGKLHLSPDTGPVGLPSRLRIRIGGVTTLIGLLIFLLGALPSAFGIDSSPDVGFVQIAVLMIGLGLLCAGGFISLTAFWKNGDRTIAADIGSRLVATGYVVAFYVGMADNLGITQQFAKTRFFGPWQAVGIQVGEAVIAVGFLLLIPYRRMIKKEPTETGKEVPGGSKKYDLN